MVHPGMTKAEQQKGLGVSNYGERGMKMDTAKGEHGMDMKKAKMMMMKGKKNDGNERR